MQCCRSSWNCGSRSGDDATVMIYIPSTDPACSGVSGWCVWCVARHPPFLSNKVLPRPVVCLFYWPRQLPTTPRSAGARAREPQSLSKPQPVRCALPRLPVDSGRPPRPSDNGDLHPSLPHPDSASGSRAVLGHTSYDGHRGGQWLAADD